MVVEDPQSGFVGAIIGVEGDRVELEDRHGRVRVFPLGPGFLVDGRPVILTAPGRAVPAGPARTASGSVKVAGGRARVALAGRIDVEGRHDAELVEQVWGDDLRAEGVVVEYLGGVDDLVDIVASFRPGPGRRLGVLVDHLVTASKETRIAEAVRRGPGGEHTLVVGHPYVDIWQAVGPQRVLKELARHLAGLAERGLLHVEDPGRAAVHFAALIAAFSSWYSSQVVPQLRAIASSWAMARSTRPAAR